MDTEQTENCNNFQFTEQINTKKSDSLQDLILDDMSNVRLQETKLGQIKSSYTNSGWSFYGEDNSCYSEDMQHEAEG